MHHRGGGKPLLLPSSSSPLSVNPTRQQRQRRLRRRRRRQSTWGFLGLRGKEEAAAAAEFELKPRSKRKEGEKTGGFNDGIVFYEGRRRGLFKQQFVKNVN